MEHNIVFGPFFLSMVAALPGKTIVNKKSSVPHNVQKISLRTDEC